MMIMRGMEKPWVKIGKAVVPVTTYLHLILIDAQQVRRANEGTDAPKEASDNPGLEVAISGRDIVAPKKSFFSQDGNAFCSSA